MGFSTRVRAMMQHEVPAADVEGLLRGSGQLESLREQLAERRRAGEIAHPGQPWETLRELGRAQVFFWVAQGYIAIARHLKEADEEADPGTIGYMPRMSHDQAIALLRQVADLLAGASAALADPAYDPRLPLPIALAPRIDTPGRCPVGHLKGLLAAARYLEGYAEVEVQTYAQAAAVDGAPPAIAKAAGRLRAELAAARSRLATAASRVAPILGGQPVDPITHQGAEDDLWASLTLFVWLGQIVADPSLLEAGSATGSSPRPTDRSAGGAARHIQREDRWCLTAGMARGRLVAEGRVPWAEDELEELWRNKDWRISGEEDRFLAETAELERQGVIRVTSYMVECPFDPVWAVTAPVTVLGRPLGAGSQFAYNHHQGKGELLTNFRSAPDFEQCAEDE